MTYAYRRSIDDHGREVVDLFVSETGRPAPTGFAECSWSEFLSAWRERDALVVRGKRGLRNPYEVANG